MMQMLKVTVKILFFGGLVGLFVYELLTQEAPDQGDLIDNTVTYTVTETVMPSTSIRITPSPEEVVASIAEYVTVPDGGLDWKTFSETKSIPYSFEGDDGEELHGVRPEFPADLMALDGAEVLMQGYMFPLTAGEGQEIFLFGPFPVSCPYHYHVGPALVMEAYSQEKIEFGYDAITVRGRLELVPRNDDYSIFYRLRDVTVVSQ